jgi:hypothetical protein
MPVILAVVQPQLGAERGITPSSLASPTAKPVTGDGNKSARAPVRIETGASRKSESLRQWLLQPLFRPR